ncbi:hypothetical protein NOVOSPHI9U_40334 [Novosphingobium sp. 9U]|nr:hypothetical protein NOVOSPHI9U_40334 [Novosphingobium sp. 9U]
MTLDHRSGNEKRRICTGADAAHYLYHGPVRGGGVPAPFTQTGSIS